MNRRDALRLMTLSALAVAGVPALAGCGDTAGNTSGTPLFVGRVVDPTAS